MAKLQYGKALLQRLINIAIGAIIIKLWSPVVILLYG